MKNRATPQDEYARIAARAYEIWEDEGCPEGRAELHWAMAETLVRGHAPPPPEASPQAAPAQAALPAAKPAAAKRAPAPGRRSAAPSGGGTSAKVK